MQLEELHKRGQERQWGRSEWVEAFGVAEMLSYPCRSGHDRSLPSPLQPCLLGAYS